MLQKSPGLGRVLDVDFMGSHGESKLIAMDKQANEEEWAVKSPWQGR
jgi:hypothetical protein